MEHTRTKTMYGNVPFGKFVFIMVSCIFTSIQSGLGDSVAVQNSTRGLVRTSTIQHAGNAQFSVENSNRNAIKRVWMGGDKAQSRTDWRPIAENERASAKTKQINFGELKWKNFQNLEKRGNKFKDGVTSRCNSIYCYSVEPNNKVSGNAVSRAEKIKNCLLEKCDNFPNNMLAKKVMVKREMKEDMDYISGLNYPNVTFVNETDLFKNNDNETLNDSLSDAEYLDQIREFIFPKAWTWVLIFFHSVVFIIGLVGNTLVCVAVYRNHTMRTVTNYFIVNLAVADFLVIFICLPPSVVWDVTSTWFFGVTMCKITLYLQTVSVTVSVLTLAFISIDRWYAICFPLKFKSTTGRAKTAIGVIWLLALTFDIPELVVFHTVRMQEMQIDTIYFTQCEPEWSRETDTSWTILKVFLLYAVPLLFMTITYCQIINVLWKSGSSGRHQTIAINTNSSVEGQIRSRIKAAKMLVVVVVMFAVCYFPVHLLSVLRLTVGMTNSETNRAFALISHWLCYANSAVNPVIYNFMSGKFRKEFRRAIDCCATQNLRADYELNSMYYKHTIKDSASRRSQSDSSCKRQLIEIRSNDVDFGYNRRSTKTSIFRMDV